MIRLISYLVDTPCRSVEGLGRNWYGLGQSITPRWPFLIFIVLVIVSSFCNHVLFDPQPLFKFSLIPTTQSNSYHMIIWRSVPTSLVHLHKHCHIRTFSVSLSSSSSRCLPCQKLSLNWAFNLSTRLPSWDIMIHVGTWGDDGNENDVGIVEDDDDIDDIVVDIDENENDVDIVEDDDEIVVDLDKNENEVDIIRWWSSFFQQPGCGARWGLCNRHLPDKQVRKKTRMYQWIITVAEQTFFHLVSFISSQSDPLWSNFIQFSVRQHASTLLRTAEQIFSLLATWNSWQRSTQMMMMNYI